MRLAQLVLTLVAQCAPLFELLDWADVVCDEEKCGGVENPRLGAEEDGMSDTLGECVPIGEDGGGG